MSNYQSKTDFKQVILSDKEKKIYNIGGIQVNNIDDIENNSICVSPTDAPSFK